MKKDNYHINDLALCLLSKINNNGNNIEFVKGTEFIIIGESKRKYFLDIINNKKYPYYSEKKADKYLDDYVAIDSKIVPLVNFYGKERNIKLPNGDHTTLYIPLENMYLTPNMISNIYDNLIWRPVLEENNTNDDNDLPINNVTKPEEHINKEIDDSGWELIK